ncbi:Ribosomal large subunit pseudouridine synthase D [Rhynchospora pubera]|uniref:Ribosomal large subunit pseudouridine synthase D n=1 Tax=Rhynchospora pubera TaxID=906938 RepID=A0AAV8E725_9POAL|nr:Ribosomal large subunit pseudouridine synthase D [Rhynchospora pubera]
MKKKKKNFLPFCLESQFSNSQLSPKPEVAKPLPMLSSHAAALASLPSSLPFLRRSARLRLSTSLLSSLASTSSVDPSPPVRSKYGGIRLEETVEVGSEKSRLDAWIASRMHDVSRSRIVASIRSGLVTVNGRAVDKVSYKVKGGDVVSCTVSELQPLRAEAEDIPLDIVYEDEHVIVVNKPPHMVVHPAPGNPNGTLVNAILHHCKVSTFTWRTNSASLLEEGVDSSDEEIEVFHVDEFPTGGNGSQVGEALVRPGIVHRLDKGTSGLLVVAKDEHAHAHLAEQFKLHTIKRVYVSLTIGVPKGHTARVEVPIGRDPNNRLRMIATPSSSNRYARHAASRYKVIEVLAGGACALVEWRLETGRTHQIRAHAKYIGVPLLGDEVYGGTKNMVTSLLRAKNPSHFHDNTFETITKLDRPCLHALSLGFNHPHTGEFLQFSRPPPDDFCQILDFLQSITESASDN